MPSPRFARTVACAVCLWGLAAAAVHADGGGWDSVELPGSAASLASAVGIDPATPRARLLLEIVRTVHAAPPGQSAEADAARARLEAWLAQAAASQPGRDAVLDGDGAPDARHVPLPIPERAWRALLRVGDGASPPLAPRILSDRRAALLYVGLMGVEPATRAYLASVPDLLGAIHERYASVFAAFGRSLVIRDGRMSLPGGAASVRIWEGLAGAGANDPQAFITGVLGRQAGRLAFFLDTVAHLDEPRRRFALAEVENDLELRWERVRSLARLFADRHPEWIIADRPFTRPPLDGSLVLLTLRVTQDGRLAPPASRAFWAGVFGASPRTASRSDEEEDGPADAAWLSERILGPDVLVGRERLGTVSFVQRAFHDVPADRMPDLATVARGFMDTRSIVVALERIGVTDLSLHARAVEQARRLGAAAQAPSAVTALAQFQAACVLVERLLARSAISRDVAVRLVRSLLEVPLEDGHYRGALADWMVRELLREVGGEDGRFEEALLQALAGRAPGANGTPSPRVVWDGLEYEVDVAGAELARLERVRARQYGNRLDDALSFAAAARAVSAATQPETARAACDALLAAAAELQPVTWPAPGLGGDTAPVSGVVAPACERLKQQARSARDLEGRGVRRLAGELAVAADAVLADTLTATVYALHVGDPAGAVDLAPDIARRHRYRLHERDAARRVRGAWDLPEERLGAGRPWHVEGSLLGLENGLGKLSLRFLFGTMPSQPRVNDNERRTIALGLALLNPVALRNADRDAIVGALLRGRARLGTPALVRGDLAALAAAAGWSEWRRESVSWAAEADPESLPSLFTLTDYFWAGLAAPAATTGLDAWGAPTTPLDGDLRLAWPLARPWEELAGRAANGQLATRFVDMTLRVAEALARFELPATLAAAALAPALADLIHEAPLGHADDWYALAGYASRLPEERMFDYIAALAAGGPLVPVDDGDDPHRPGR